MTTRKLTLVTLLVGAGIIGFGTIITNAGYRLNVSPSEPIGLWRSVPVTQIKRGMMVEACISDQRAANMAVERGYLLPGHCPGNTGTVIKAVAGIRDDYVTINQKRVLINEVVASNNPLVDQDGAGRKLSPAFLGSRKLTADQVFLLSDYTTKSFDSRYFGAVETKSIKGVAVPIWVTSWKPTGY